MGEIRIENPQYISPYTTTRGVWEVYGNSITLISGTPGSVNTLLPNTLFSNNKEISVSAGNITTKWPLGYFGVASSPTLNNIKCWYIGEETFSYCSAQSGGATRYVTSYNSNSIFSIVNENVTVWKWYINGELKYTEVDANLGFIYPYFSSIPITNLDGLKYANVYYSDVSGNRNYSLIRSNHNSNIKTTVRFR